MGTKTVGSEFHGPTIIEQLLTFMCINNGISAFWRRVRILVHSQIRVFLLLWNLLAHNSSTHKLNQKQILRLEWQRRTFPQERRWQKGKREANKPFFSIPALYISSFLWPVHELRLGQPLALGWMPNMTLVFSVSVPLWMSTSESCGMNPQQH